MAVCAHFVSSVNTGSQAGPSSLMARNCEALLIIIGVEAFEVRWGASARRLARQLPRRGEFAPAVGGGGSPRCRSAEFAKARARREARVARQGVDGGRQGLVFEHHGVDFEPGENRAPRRASPRWRRCRRRISCWRSRAARRRSPRRRSPNSRSGAASRDCRRRQAGVEADAELHRMKGRPPPRPRAQPRSTRPAPPHPSAAATACAAWAASSSGAFQNAMIASPMYLSTVPRLGEHDVGHRRQIFVEKAGEFGPPLALRKRGERSGGRRTSGSACARNPPSRITRMCGESATTAGETKRPNAHESRSTGAASGL